MMSRSKVVIRGPWRDTIRFVRHIFYRRRIFRRASEKRPAEGNIAELSAAVHPDVQSLIITEIRQESPSVQTYRLTPLAAAGGRKNIAPFQAGQYLSINVELESGRRISRPYSISNAPEDAYRDNGYEITIKTDPSAFIPKAISDTWKPGTVVEASGPEGFFTYEPLRDSAHLVCLAGGSGITPFRSLIGDVLSRRTGVTITLVQGAAGPEELLYDQEFQNLAENNSGRFKRIVVLSEEPKGGESRDKSHRHGFINAEILAEAMEGKESAVFICGPQGMHQFIDKELENLDVPPKRIRREDYGIPGSPSGLATFNLTIVSSDMVQTIPADRNETVLVAIERAGLKLPSRCRTGSCGWCRSALKNGKIRYEKVPEGLRSADREQGYFHPCTAKPETDLTIEIPGNPGKTTVMEANSGISS